MSHVEHDPDTEWMAERYAAGKMSAGEEQQFEELLFQSPRLVSHVAAAHGIRTGFTRLQHNQELNHLLRRRSVIPMPYALAAALLVCVIGGTTLLSYLKPSPDARVMMATSVSALHIPGHPRQVAGPFLLANTRSQAQPLRIQIPPQPQAAALRILPEMSSSSGQYQVTISPLTNTGTVPSSGELSVAADPSGFLEVYIDPSALGPGNFQVSVVQPNHTERFELRLSR